jgi:DNA-binding response OmpR family regulator
MAKIFYVEDDKTLRDLYCLLLTKPGHSVIDRCDTGKADAIISIWKPDLVITDHNLGAGKETGLSLARRLHADGIKVAILSSCHETEDIAGDEGIPFFRKGTSINKVLGGMKIDEFHQKPLH